MQQAHMPLFADDLVDTHFVSPSKPKSMHAFQLRQNLLEAGTTQRLDKHALLERHLSVQARLFSKSILEK